MMTLHSRLVRGSCALKNKNLPLLCRGREMGREFIVQGPREQGFSCPLRYGTVVV